jgi:hypothetical protein
MKKKTTLANQSDKTETNKSEFISYRHIHIRFYHDYTFCDHSHGRINRYPFGSGKGPIAY